MTGLMQKEIYGERFIISAANLPYKQIFTWIASSLSHPAPTIAATPFLSQIAWRIEHLRKHITGSKPLITRETALAANNIYQYSNNKIIDELQLEFLPVKTSITDAVEFYMKNNNNSK